jgi:EAL domain-containing protein (putative c-di-GMP-specific phosphodiesterase class I)
VIAEGIETDGQLAQLQSLDCDHGQGYWFSRPVEEASLGQLLGERTWQRQSA